MRTITRPAAIGRRAVGLAVALFVAAGATRGQSIAEELVRPDGRKVAGRIEGNPRIGFRFTPADGSAPIPIEPGMTIRREAPTSATPPTTAGLPPFHLLAGEAARLSGTLRSVGDDRVTWSIEGRSGEIILPRACVQAIVQRPGEARVLSDSFESIDSSRWSSTGHPEIVDGPHVDGSRALQLAGPASSITHELAEPLAAGRLEIAFHDDGSIVPGRECVVEPTFRGPTSRAAIRIRLGWSEESLAVISPSGPTLQVQRLARSSGWHRLAIRFGPGETEISVDGRELAHGREPIGPLGSIRLAVRSEGTGEKPGPSATFDDLRLVRFAEPPASVEVDPGQDEARLVVGDQIFGQLRSANGDRVEMQVEGRPVPLRWGEVSGLYLRRLPAQGATVEGPLARVEWLSTPAERASNLDFVEGALIDASGDSLTIATPFTGNLTIPREALRRLSLAGWGRRIVVDVAAHHLGDEPSTTRPMLDPPQPEGLSLERSFELADVPDPPAELVLDVVQVQPESGSDAFSAQVRKGELRTYALVNGRRIDYLNRHVREVGDTPERIRLPIPRGLLRPGRNVIRLELTGDHDPRPNFDDLGVLQIAIEFPKPAPAP